MDTSKFESACDKLGTGERLALARRHGVMGMLTDEPVKQESYDSLPEGVRRYLVKAYATLSREFRTSPALVVIWLAENGPKLRF